MTEEQKKEVNPAYPVVNQRLFRSAVINSGWHNLDLDDKTTRDYVLSLKTEEELREFETEAFFHRRYPEGVKNREDRIIAKDVAWTSEQRAVTEPDEEDGKEFYEEDGLEQQPVGPDHYQFFQYGPMQPPYGFQTGFYTAPPSNQQVYPMPPMPSGPGQWAPNYLMQPGTYWNGQNQVVVGGHGLQMMNGMPLVQQLQDSNDTQPAQALNNNGTNEDQSMSGNFPQQSVPSQASLAPAHPGPQGSPQGSYMSQDQNGPNPPMPSVQQSQGPGQAQPTPMSSIPQLLQQDPNFDLDHWNETMARNFPPLTKRLDQQSSSNQQDDSSQPNPTEDVFQKGQNGPNPPAPPCQDPGQVQPSAPMPTTTQITQQKSVSSGMNGDQTMAGNFPPMSNGSQQQFPANQLPQPQQIPAYSVPQGGYVNGPNQVVMGGQGGQQNPSDAFQGTAPMPSSAQFVQQVPVSSYPLPQGGYINGPNQGQGAQVMNGNGAPTIQGPGQVQPSAPMQNGAQLVGQDHNSNGTNVIQALQQQFFANQLPQPQQFPRYPVPQEGYTNGSNQVIFGGLGPQMMNGMPTVQQPTAPMPNGAQFVQQAPNFNGTNEYQAMSRNQNRVSRNQRGRSEPPVQKRRGQANGKQAMPRGQRSNGNNQPFTHSVGLALPAPLRGHRNAQYQDLIGNQRSQGQAGYQCPYPDCNFLNPSRNFPRPNPDGRQRQTSNGNVENRGGGDCRGLCPPCQVLLNNIFNFIERISQVPSNQNCQDGCADCNCRNRKRNSRYPTNRDGSESWNNLPNEQRGTSTAQSKRETNSSEDSCSNCHFDQPGNHRHISPYDLMVPNSNEAFPSLPTRRVARDVQGTSADYDDKLAKKAQRSDRNKMQGYEEAMFTNQTRRIENRRHKDSRAREVNEDNTNMNCEVAGPSNPELRQGRQVVEETQLAENRSTSTPALSMGSEGVDTNTDTEDERPSSVDSSDSVSITEKTDSSNTGEVQNVVEEVKIEEPIATTSNAAIVEKKDKDAIDSRAKAEEVSEDVKQIDQTNPAISSAVTPNSSSNTSKKKNKKSRKSDIPINTVTEKVVEKKQDEKTMTAIHSVEVPKAPKPSTLSFRDMLLKKTSFNNIPTKESNKVVVVPVQNDNKVQKTENPDKKHNSETSSSPSTSDAPTRQPITYPRSDNKVFDKDGFELVRNGAPAIVLKPIPVMKQKVAEKPKQKEEEEPIVETDQEESKELLKPETQNESSSKKKKSEKKVPQKPSKKAKKIKIPIIIITPPPEDSNGSEASTSSTSNTEADDSQREASPSRNDMPCSSNSYVPNAADSKDITISKKKTRKDRKKIPEEFEKFEEVVLPDEEPKKLVETEKCVVDEPKEKRSNEPGTSGSFVPMRPPPNFKPPLPPIDIAAIDSHLEFAKRQKDLRLVKILANKYIKLLNHNLDPHRKGEGVKRWSNIPRLLRSERVHRLRERGRRAKEFLYDRQKRIHTNFHFEEVVTLTQFYNALATNWNFNFIPMLEQLMSIENPLQLNDEEFALVRLVLNDPTNKNPKTIRIDLDFSP